MRILNMGSMNLDYVYRVHDFPKAGETLTAIEQSVSPGGKGLNQSIALAKAGAEVFHACLMGRGGEMLVDVMKENEVDITYIKPVDAMQGNAVIYVNDAGENHIVLYGGSNRMLTREYIEATLESFGEGDYILLQNEVNLLEDIISIAYNRGISVVLNPSPCDENIGEIDFEKLSMIFINEIEGRQLTGEVEPEKILGSLAAWYPKLKIVLTLGSEGAFYKDEHQIVFQESVPVTAVDTTAAGDTFSGYFLACFLRELPVNECMSVATKAAAIAVTRSGACESIPLWGEVMADEI